MSLGLREYHQRALRANVGGVTCRGMATEMGITDFSTATQWRALAVEALQGPQTTRLSRLQQRRWLWAGGAVLGGFQVCLSSSTHTVQAYLCRYWLNGSMRLLTVSVTISDHSLIFLSEMVSLCAGWLQHACHHGQL